MSAPEKWPTAVVIPAFNEAERIAATVAGARALPGVILVVVVSDGSSDETAERAREAGAHVVLHARNRGKAAAMETGANAAQAALPSDFCLLFLDADLENTTSEAAPLLAPVLCGAADMSIATFPHLAGRGGGRGVVVRTARWGIARATGRTMAAPLSGQRCITRAAFAAARPLARGFGVETALTIDVLRAGFRVVEVPARLDHRVTGRDWRSQRHRLRQLRDVVRALAPRLLFVRRGGKGSSHE